MQKKSRLKFILMAYALSLCLPLPYVFSENEPEQEVQSVGPPSSAEAETKIETVQPSNHLSFVEGEIVEVNELKDPAGCAIYKVKIFETGETIELFADADRSLILAGNESKEAAEILDGTKATIIYGEIKKQDLPIIVFARVASTSTV